MVARLAITFTALMSFGACATDPADPEPASGGDAGPFLTVLSDGTKCPKGAIVAGGESGSGATTEACIAMRMAPNPNWVLHGKHLTWHPADAWLQVERWYRFGAAHGPHRVFDSSGKVTDEKCYLDAVAQPGPCPPSWVPPT